MNKLNGTQLGTEKQFGIVTYLIKVNERFICFFNSLKLDCKFLTPFV